MDSDFHNIYNEKNELINKDANVLIGDNGWICSKSIILKESNIPNNNVIGSGSIYSKSIGEENCIIAGIPAKIVKKYNMETINRRKVKL